MNDQPKKPYAKPEVTEVPLRPEEAVLGTCKSMTQGGPGSMMGITCVMVACSQPGT